MATIRIPDAVPSPDEDCESLNNAFRGLGTDEKAVIRILGCRNVAQRKEIRETYHRLYDKSLLDSLTDELSGDFGKAVILWTYDPAERDARLANEALKSRRKSITQLQVIVEIACAASPHHLVDVRKTYCSLFGSSLEEDIVLSNVPRPIQKILVSLVSSYRYDKQVVDYNVAHAEAAKLHDAVEAKKLSDDEFVHVLSTRNAFQLRETFKCYKDDYGKFIDEDIMASGKGLLESISGKGLLESIIKVVVWCIDAPEKHFAEVIRSAIVGFGTDEDSLTRGVVSRAEIDMMKVRGAYIDANKSTMEDAIIGDTSGDYKDFLLTLIGVDV